MRNYLRCVFVRVLTSLSLLCTKNKVWQIGKLPRRKKKETARTMRDGTIPTGQTLSRGAHCRLSRRFFFFCSRLVNASNSANFLIYILQFICITSGSFLCAQRPSCVHVYCCLPPFGLFLSVMLPAPGGVFLHVESATVSSCLLGG